jgi:hypothetical protein
MPQSNSTVWAVFVDLQPEYTRFDRDLGAEISRSVLRRQPRLAFYGPREV